MDVRRRRAFCSTPMAYRGYCCQSLTQHTSITGNLFQAMRNEYIEKQGRAMRINLLIEQIHD